MKTRFITGLFILTAALLIASLYHHPREKILTWEGEIWADRAGYYMYLPAIFLYGLDTQKAPEGIDEKTGYGFRIDKEKNKFETKYSYGVALLISPLFIATHFGAGILDIYQNGGFSLVYHRMADFAAILYLMLGLWMLNLFLARYLKEWIRYIVIIILLGGTNLFYYTVIDPLMSHVYSFFLFCGFLLFFIKFLEKRTLQMFAIMSLFIALIALIRPTNLLILSVFFFWDVASANDFRDRLRLFFKPAHILVFLLAFLMIYLPQMIYWNYLHGSFLYYAYTGEGFTNWNNPKFVEVLFSSLNGLLPYSPIVLFILAGIAFMIIKKKQNGFFLVLLFIGLTYLVSSWYNWYYGCSFGQRSYVEYYALLSFPLGILLKGISESRNKILQIFSFLVILLFVIFSIKMSFAYRKCFFGSTWDWPKYSLLLGDAGFGSNTGKKLVHTNDFENVVLTNTKTSAEKYHSGMQSARAVPDIPYCCSYTVFLWDFQGYYPSKVNVNLWILNENPDKTGAFLVCSIEKEEKVLNWQAASLDQQARSLDWSRINAEFSIPAGLDASTMIKIYIWNKEKADFFVDDLQVKFE